MKNTKRMFINIPAYNTDEIENILEDQAKDGWFLQDVNRIFGYFIFKRSNPKNVYYSIVFYSKGSEFDTDNEEGQKELQDFCEYSGWKLVVYTTNVLIFSNENETPKPIETDPYVKFKEITKTLKEILIFNSIGPIILFLTNFIFFFGCLYNYNMIDILSNQTYITALIISFLSFLICIINFISYLSWNNQIKKTIKGLGIYKPTKQLGFYYIPLILAIISFYFRILSIFKNKPKYYLLVGSIILLIIVLCILVFLLISALKKKNIKKKVTKIIFISCFIIIVSTIVIYIQGSIDKYYIETSSSNYKIIQFDDHKIYQYNDEIPLSTTDFIEVDSKSSSNHLGCDSSSIVMNYLNANQYFLDKEHFKEYINYFVIKVNLKIFYNSIQKTTIKKLNTNINNEGYEYRLIDDNDWDGNKVYRLYIYDNPKNDYFICYDDCFIHFHLNMDLDLNKEQKIIIRDNLLDYVNNME